MPRIITSNTSRRTRPATAGSAAPASAPASAQHRAALAALLALSCLSTLGSGISAAQDQAQSALPAATADPEIDALIAELLEQGATSAVDGVYSEALASFEQARDLNKRAHGLFTQDQIDIAYQLHLTARLAGDFASAIAYQSEALRITRRALENSAKTVGETEGTGSPAYLEARLALARWLASQTGRPPGAANLTWSREARVVYAEILDLIDDEFGKDPELKVQVLRLMAADIGTHSVTSSSQIYMDGTGNVYASTSYSFSTLSEPIELDRAERISKRTDSPMLQASVLRDVGDWRLAAGNPDKAAKAYRKAWKLLAAAENGRMLQLLLFEEPQLLEDIPDRRPQRFARGARSGALFGVLSTAPYAAGGEVDLEFIVNEDGEAEDIRVVSADPQWAADSAISMVRASLFRPQFEEGEFRVAPGRYTWTFRYDALEAARRGLPNIATY